METITRLSCSPTVVGRSTTTTRTWHRFALIGILLLTAFLHFFRLEQEGYANLYYAAAVKSMLTSWHNFFFISFDPGGFVTVDKPPLGLWMQAASAALFGFNGVSLLLPQAVAGVLSVILLHHLVRRTFGPTAGLLAALVLAVTPISVAANRNNTMDSQLVLVLLLAAWAVIRATETGRLRWLLLCGALVGVGFNIKMLQAFLVLPAFYLLYLVAAPVRWWKRLTHLGLATVVLLALSLAWVVAVDMTPPEARPYVGSSSDNTVMELIVGHNGLKRLLPGGKNWTARLGTASAPSNSARGPSLLPPGEQPGRPEAPVPPPSGQPGRPPAGSPPPGGRPGQPPTLGRSGGSPFSQETGEPGLLRLFNHQLAGQISWLLPLAGLGFLAAAWQTRPRFPLARRHQNLLLWAAWLLPMVVFFSVANLFHRYYLEMLAPAIAALVGAGVVALWEDYHRPGWRGWLLPLALVGSGAFEATILSEFPDWSHWLTPLVVGLCLAAAGVLVIIRLVRRSDKRACTGVATATGVLALLVPMVVWAFIPVWYGGHTGLPYAGPDLLAEPGGGGGALKDEDRLVDYLLTNQGNVTYLAATLNAPTAAPIILATGEPVMAMGGFTGGDPILTVDELAESVADGTVRFFLVSPDSRGNHQNDLTRWVMERCVTVPQDEWEAALSGPGRPSQLFDCAH
ncbi:MAG: glycosyltransferase family 39 protein [Chloroflexota bacterium]|nr:glycosyltransferase family 39 protein [Chloroflexota bacterium]